MSAHTFNTSSLVSKATKQALTGESMLVNTVDTSYSGEFTQKGYVSGQSITIEIDAQATISSGRVGTLQNIKPTTVSATLGQYNGVFDMTSIQKKYDQNGEAGVVKFGRTIARRLIREIERTGFAHAAKYFGDAVGSAGTSPGSYRTWAEAKAKLDDKLNQGRVYAACNPTDMVALADSLKHATNPGTDISKIYRKGQVYHMADMDFYSSPSIYRHTAGTADNTTPLVDGAPTNATNVLHIDGTTNGDIVTVGTRFTVGTVGSSDAVYDVDPETKENLPYLKKFCVVEESSASSGSGDVDLTLSEYMYDSTDSRQNVSQLPPDGATITFDTEDEEQAYANIVYGPEALSLISVPAAADSSGGLKETFTNYKGLSVRTAIHPRDAINDTETLRVDAIWAWTSPRPEHGKIVWGA